MKTIKLLTAIIMVMMAIPTFAQDATTPNANDKGLYFGGVEISSVSIANYCSSFSSTTSCSGSEIGLGFSGGYRFNDFFAAEIKSLYASGFDRTTRYEYSNGNVRTNESTRKNLNIGFGAQGQYPVGEKINIIGRAGFHSWHSWTKISDIDTDSYGTNITKISRLSSGVDPYFGMGGSMVINDKITANIGYTLYTQQDLDVIHGGLTINF